MSDDAARNATDEETATFLPGLLLVDSFEVLTTLIATEAEPEPHLAIYLKLIGRENGTGIRRVQNAVLRPDGMAALVRTISESYQHGASRLRDSFGRPL